MPTKERVLIGIAQTSHKTRHQLIFKLLLFPPLIIFTTFVLHLSLDILAQESSLVILLSQGNTLLAQNSIRSSQVKEQVGQSISVDIISASQLHRLSRSKTKSDSLSLPLVDSFSIRLFHQFKHLGDACVECLECVEVLPVERQGLDACGAGDDLLGNVGDVVDLEAQREHILGELGLGEAGGVGVDFGLLEDGREGVEGILGQDDGRVVECVAHGDLIRE